MEALWEELALLLGPKKEVSQATPEPQDTAPQATRSVSEQPGAEAEFSLEQLNDGEKRVTKLEADLAQRDKFINVLQDQIRDDKQKTQQARQETEIKVKRGFMQELAEPLNQLQLAVGSNKTEELTLINESFTLALEVLGITPIGEIDRQFTVSQKDSVKPRDHKSVMEQKVQQTTLGWELHLSNGIPRLLVKPEVKRLEEVKNQE
jgi:molecular chaperone GrpE (heat shock protein)